MNFGELCKMKFLYLVLLPTFLLAKCYYTPCNSQVQSGKKDTKISLEKEFQKVKNEMLNLRDNYKAHLKTLKEDNQRLEEKIALYKEKALNHKEVLFLLHKGLNLEDKNINLEAR